MSQSRIAVVGYGKMGHAVEQLAREGDWEVVAVLDDRWNSAQAKDALHGASVAIEFTEPGSAPANIRAIVDAGCPVVVGTTGWYGEMDAVVAHVKDRNGSLLWSPNFSVGAQILISLARTAGAIMRNASSFDAHLVETHHSAKKDMPSGTANAIADAAAAALGRSIPITSVRTGFEPGTHELIFDAPFEQIRMVHRARDRRVFAAGALMAARWLLTCKPGVYTMQDMLGSTREGE